MIAEHATLVAALASDPAVSTTLPVSLQEAKEHLRILHNDLDSAILTALEAAVEYCEATKGRALRERVELRQTYCEWPCSPVGFDRQPVRSVASVKYYDANGTLTTVSSSLYRLVQSTEAASFLEFDDVFTFPTLDVRPDAIQVNYTAGYAVGTAVPIVPVVPARAKQAILLKTAELFGDLKPAEAQAAARSCDDLLATLDWGCYR